MRLDARACAPDDHVDRFGERRGAATEQARMDRDSLEGGDPRPELGRECLGAGERLLTLGRAVEPDTDLDERRGVVCVAGRGYRDGASPAV
jgi:hypothetical protein